MAFKHKVNAESEARVYLTDKWNNIKHEMVLNMYKNYKKCVFVCEYLS